MIEKHILERFIPFVLKKLSKREEFNPDLICQSLIKETSLNPEDAQMITLDVVRRIVDSKIKYVTSPMIREITNTILLKHGFEKERLQYTRIGFPLYDLKCLFNSKGDIDKEILIHIKTEYKAVLDLINKITESGIIY